MIKKQIPSALPFLRRRLVRWEIDVPPGHRPGIAVAAMKEVWAHTPPRVAVVLLFTPERMGHPSQVSAAG